MKMVDLVKSDEEEDVKDFVRLWIAFMFASFLFPNDHYNCPLPLLSYFDDLEGTWRYAWAVSIRDQLMESLRKVWPSVKNRNEGKYLKSSIGYLFGYMAILCKGDEKDEEEPAPVEPKKSLKHHVSIGSKKRKLPLIRQYQQMRLMKRCKRLKIEVDALKAETAFWMP
ncbi:hypothetical protein QJS04_geneDACA016118 [Acorus gramineus]|uniref:Aminotransferase-like plant mobile domain-containing protein n=1 Tax=Acorus gramineus TaxID=55184 RepID=A0AAV9BX47_ACOGR|nr:hypothetical protein QJS04_geneDACA016118 [Acorus gramineus]